MSARAALATTTGTRPPLPRPRPPPVPRVVGSVAARAAIGRLTRQTAYPTTPAMTNNSANQIRPRRLDVGRGSFAGAFSWETVALVMHAHLLGRLENLEATERPPAHRHLADDVLAWDQPPCPAVRARVLVIA